MAYSEENAQHWHWVNFLQSAEEARDKYTILRAAGVPAPWARRLRCWTWSHIDVWLKNFHPPPTANP